jgi:hypothetical protein
LLCLPSQPNAHGSCTRSYCLSVSRYHCLHISNVLLCSARFVAARAAACVASDAPALGELSCETVSVSASADPQHLPVSLLLLCQCLALYLGLARDSCAKYSRVLCARHVRQLMRASLPSTLILALCSPSSRTRVVSLCLRTSVAHLRVHWAGHLCSRVLLIKPLACHHGMHCVGRR